jgi:hypothetical protein
LLGTGNRELGTVPPEASVPGSRSVARRPSPQSQSPVPMSPSPSRLPTAGILPNRIDASHM